VTPVARRTGGAGGIAGSGSGCEGGGGGAAPLPPDVPADILPPATAERAVSVGALQAMAAQG
jgi:hypothetical protein